MVFLHVNHWCQWFFNGFFTCESLASMVSQWFFRSQPLVSMVFPMVFNNRTIAIAWMVCGSPLTSMVYQWFWGKWMLVHKKRPNRKKTWFFQQKHRGKQTLDRLTWPNVTKVSLGNHFSSILAFWLPPLQHLQVFILTMNGWKTTIDINGFTMVFGLKNHWYQWVFNGFWSKNYWYQWFFQWFLVQKPLVPMVFSMVFGPKTIGTNGFSMVL